MGRQVLTLPRQGRDRNGSLELPIKHLEFTNLPGLAAISTQPNWSLKAKVKKPQLGGSEHQFRELDALLGTKITTRKIFLELNDIPQLGVARSHLEVGCLRVQLFVEWKTRSVQVGVSFLRLPKVGLALKGNQKEQQQHGGLGRAGDSIWMHNPLSK